MRLISKKHKKANKLTKYESKIKKLYETYGPLDDSYRDVEDYHFDRDEIFYEFFKDISEDRLSLMHIKKISNLFKDLPDRVWYS